MLSVLVELVHDAVGGSKAVVRELGQQDQLFQCIAIEIEVLIEGTEPRPDGLALIVRVARSGPQ